MNTYLKKKQIKKFDPEGFRASSELFGLPFTVDTAEIIVIPVPWDVTSSLQGGACLGPSALLNASSHIELHENKIEDAWKMGIAMMPIDEGWVNKNNEARNFTEVYFNYLKGGDIQLSDKEIGIIVKNINALSENINEWVLQKSNEIIAEGKIPVVLGGDHSAPFGLMKAIAKKYDSFGVLQIGNKANLISKHQRFTHSHASVMFNVLRFEQLTKLVQLGLRDVNAPESDVISSDNRIVSVYEYALATEHFEGMSWNVQTDRIISELPEQIYISLDINSLSPQLAGKSNISPWLTYHHLVYLFEKLALADKKIIAFDLCEVSGNQDSWHATIGARMLYSLSNITGVTHKLLRLK